jgi:hypothetical protein
MLRYDFPKLLLKDSYKYLFEAYDRNPVLYTQLFNVIQSDSAFEQKTNALRDIKLKKIKEGDPVIKANALEGWTMYGKNEKFGSKYEFTLELAEDTPADKIANIVKEVASGWGEGLNMTKETYYATIFNKGGLTAGHEIFNGSITGVVTDPSGDLLYDGKPLFNLTGNARTAKSGTTYYNGISLALSVPNLQTAYSLQTSTNAYDDNGDRIYLKPDTLLIPPALHFTAKSVLENEWVGSNANLDINPVQNLVTPIEWAYLSDASAWFLGVKQKGLYAIERKSGVLTSWQDNDTGSFYIKIDARFGVMIDNWRYWIGSNVDVS